MSVLPKGERVKRAISWVSGELQSDPSKSAMALAHEAVARFDLTPIEGEELIAFYRSAREIGEKADG